MLKWVLDFIGSCWEEFRDFSFKYKTLIEVLFILIYTAEQAFLIWVVALMELTQEFRLDVISYFTLVVLLTFSLHKLVIESRARIFEEKLHAMKYDFELYKSRRNEIRRLAEEDEETFKYAKNNEISRENDY